MHRDRLSRAVVVAVGALFALLRVASATPITITITPSVGPAVNDPAYTQYAANSIFGQMNGTTVSNQATDPAAYAPTSSLTVAQMVYTADYNSWMGTADPTGPFANEHGNALYFGVNIQGNGNTFSLAQLNEMVNSSDPTNYFHDVFSYSQSSYSKFLQGITPSGQVITSGPATQVVSQILYVGISLSFDGSKYNFSNYPSDQATLDAAIADYNQFAGNITTTYSLSNTRPLVTSSVTVPLNSTVPEPTTALIGGVGLIAVLITASRRQSTRRNADAD